jgi:serine/threonine-protein kinase
MRTGEGVALGGRYRLVRTIAVGGMGEVWEALDESLARPVAVKVLRPEFAGDGPLLARFRVEARNSANLSHPNIAPLFDYGEDSGTAYLVMELVPGDPLSDILEAEPVLTPARLLPILSQTARGLHYAHQMGVVHRDVKPGNLLVEQSGRVRITDFGVSVAIDQTPMTATGMVMGTAQYLSPEQAVGRPATPLSDLYALGIVAYEALAGRRPFTGGSAVDIAVAQVNDPVPALPETVDPRLARLVLQLLDKNPANRPQSGAELARLFDTLIARTPPAGTARVAEPGVAARHAPAPDAPPAGAVRGAAPPRLAAPPRTAAPPRAAAPARTAAPAGQPPAFPPRFAPPQPAPAALPAGTRPGAPVALSPTGQPLTRRTVHRGLPTRTPGHGSTAPRPPTGRSTGSGTRSVPDDRARSGRPSITPRWPRIAALLIGLALVVLLGVLVGHAVLADGRPDAPPRAHVAALNSPILSNPRTVPALGGTPDRGGLL